MTRRSRWASKNTGTEAERARRAEYASAEYRAMERALVAEVRRGRSHCWRCGAWLDPSARGPRGERLWHVGHDDDDRTVIRGPECAGCNLSAAAKKGARVRNGAPPADQQRRTGPTRISL